MQPLDQVLDRVLGVDTAFRVPTEVNVGWAGDRVAGIPAETHDVTDMYLIADAELLGVHGRQVRQVPVAPASRNVHAGGDSTEPTVREVDDAILGGKHG